MTLLAILLRL